MDENWVYHIIYICIQREKQISSVNNIFAELPSANVELLPKFNSYSNCKTLSNYVCIMKIRKTNKNINLGNGIILYILYMYTYDGSRIFCRGTVHRKKT